MGIFLTILFLHIIGVATLILYILISSYFDKKYYASKNIHYQGNSTFRALFSIIKGANMMTNITLMYKKLKSENHPCAIGTGFGMTTLSVIDPTLLKSVFVKDFDHFADRRLSQKSANSNSNIFISKIVLFLTGDKWKALRSKLSPTFTSGKIKRIFPLFNASGKKLVNFVDKEQTSGEIDVMEVYSKYTMDIIATAVCGIDSGAFDQKEPSFFEKMGSKMQLQFGGVKLFQIMILMALPKLGDWLGFSLFEKDAEEFFYDAIKSSIRHRQENKEEKRNDFLQLMLEARESKVKVDENELESFEKDAIIKSSSSSQDGGGDDDDILNDDGVVANAVGFMLAGYETTQSVLIFCAYALALNPDVQDKLREEVDNIMMSGEDIGYDEINKMTYLEMVINETLRFYPPSGATDRLCTKDYKVPGTDLVLKEGQGILVPIYGIHHDEQYYPDPEKFNPERFSPQNKDKLIPYTFLPFGQGPRNCIGMRFAMAEIKVAIAHLVRNFKIEPSARTMIPITFAKTTTLKPDGGLFLALHKIQK